MLAAGLHRPPLALLRDVCKAMASGASTFVTLAVRGEIGPREAWTGLSGATKAIEAIARGDVSDDATADARKSACLACPDREPYTGVPNAVGWCGPQFSPTKKTCGCLLDAKVYVKSERCPQENWPV